ncbi:MAG: hypothetical protein IPQ25_16435, partial [Chitinophagaceae bacterium]|nr:hypothetical protein [Chitinophagaceae bacterium]
EAAAKIGYEVIQRNPKHPGALLYHTCYDNPDFAALALATADKYAAVALDAVMPCICLPIPTWHWVYGTGSKQQRKFPGQPSRQVIGKRN